MTLDDLIALRRR